MPTTTFTNNPEPSPPAQVLEYQPPLRRRRVTAGDVLAGMIGLFLSLAFLGCGAFILYGTWIIARHGATMMMTITILAFMPFLTGALGVIETLAGLLRKYRAAPQPASAEWELHQSLSRLSAVTFLVVMSFFAVTAVFSLILSDLPGPSLTLPSCIAGADVFLAFLPLMYARRQADRAEWRQ